MTSIRDQYPLRLLIGNQDCTQLLDEGATFSNVDPGGFEAASFPIPKDMPQTIVGQKVRLDCGMKVAWEGRVGQIQRSLGNRTLVTCQGYGALLKDIALREIFVAQDLTEWQAPSVERQIALVADGDSPVGPSVAVEPGSGSPALVESVTGPWETNAKPIIEAWFDTRGIPLGSLYYAWAKGANVNAPDTNWLWEAFLSTDSLASALDASGNLRAAGPGTGTLTASLANRVFALVQANYNAAAGGENTLYAIYWTALALYGRHGLTKRGTEPGGFYPSDIVGWVLGQVPGLQRGVIGEANGYIIPHSLYLAAVAAEQMVKDMGIYAGWHWGVWESLAYLTGNPTPRLDFRPYPEAGEWLASCERANCDTLDLNEDLSKLYDIAEVTYTDVTGIERTVTVEADNPLLDEAGIKRTLVLNGGTMTQGSAETFGQIALALEALQSRVAGQATITQVIEGRNGAMPAWMLKAGLDRLRITDLPGGTAFGTTNDIPVTRVETSIGSSGITTLVELGTGANLIETVQARLADTLITAGIQ